jgi:regulatory protein
VRITAIEPQKRHPERVNLHVDGAFRLALAAEVVLAEGLRRGDPVTEAQLAALEARDQAWKAREAAMSLLSFRPRSAAELLRGLRDKGYPEELAAEVVDRMRELGLIDDARFAGEPIEE